MRKNITKYNVSDNKILLLIEGTIPPLGITSNTSKESIKIKRITIIDSVKEDTIGKSVIIDKRAVDATGIYVPKVDDPKTLENIQAFIKELNSGDTTAYFKQSSVKINSYVIVNAYDVVAIHE